MLGSMSDFTSGAGISGANNQASNVPARRVMITANRRVGLFNALPVPMYMSILHYMNN